MIIRKSAGELQSMARAGEIVARVHEELRELVAPGVSTGYLDGVAAKLISDAGADPSFLNYKGFPKTVCTSVNAEIVHGIPSEDVVLERGDLLKIDAGAVVDGFHGDSAVTWIVGDDASEATRSLVADTYRGLWAGLHAARSGRRIGDVSRAVEEWGSARDYGIVRGYAGHGVGRNLHEDPTVPNYGRPGRGPKLSPGLVIAVEPMFNAGTEETEELDDGWTVKTADRSLSAHWEHTVAVTEDGPWVLTARSDEPAWPLHAASSGDRGALAAG